jgi:hypothetical protein
MLKKLPFLFDLSLQSFTASHSPPSPRQELRHLKKILKQKNIDTYYADLTLPIFEEVGYFVYKTLCPALQPLYIAEKNKEVRKERLEAISMHVRQEISPNKLPHPFL